MEILESMYSESARWVNENQGVLTVVLFAVTALYGWLSGIFSALQRRPDFRIQLLHGPSFSCTYYLGRNADNGQPLHRTAWALYLNIANIGSAPSSIENVSIAYKWDVEKFSKNWMKYSFGWFWIEKPTVSITDFQANIGENIKLYPFLLQASRIKSENPSGYLQSGATITGVVYFEQSDAYGGCLPAQEKGKTRVKIAVRDSFGKKHVAKFRIDAVSLTEARKYNPSFGNTLAELRGENIPEDIA